MDIDSADDSGVDLPDPADTSTLSEDEPNTGEALDETTEKTCIAG